MAIKYEEILENCTTNFTGQTTIPVETTEITFYADDGFEFTENGEITYSREKYNDISMDIEPTDNKEFTFKFNDFYTPLEAPIKVELKAVNSEDAKPKTQVEYEEILAHCTTNFTGQTTIPVETTEITFYADEGFEFSLNGEITYGRENSSDISLDIKPTDIKEFTYEINSFYTPLVAPIKVELRAIDSDEANDDTRIEYVEVLEHCTTNFTGKTTIPIETNEITFYADEGFEFLENGQLIFLKERYRDVTNDIIPTGIKEFTHTIDTSSVLQDPIRVELKAVKHKNELSTFTNLYLTTPTELNQISKERYIIRDSNTEYHYLDYGQFITNLFSIPFALPDDQLNEKSLIKMGEYQTEVESTVINDYILTINIGKIIIPEKYNNIFDYKNVSTRIILPYIKPIDVNSQSIINKEINIQYLINLYKGDMTINIFNDDGSVVYTNNEMLGTKIPYIQFVTDNSTNNIDVIIDNGIRTAYVEVSRNIPIVDPQGYETLESGQVKEYTGYIEASDIKLDTTASTDEQAQIKTLLRNGVII